MAVPPERLLILGGTTEAAQLARAVHAELADRFTVITSLAGRLPPRQTPPGRLRIGGFGGAEGLGRFLSAEGISVVIDATHPFASTISQNAATACSAAGIPRILLVRPPWQQEPGDRWLPVDSLDAAARLLPALARRAFLTTGPGGINAFAALAEVWFLVRLFTPAAAPLPLAQHAVIVARPPFTLAGERALIETHRIDAMVTKQSGGPTDAKLQAARQAAIPVIMIQRPTPPAGAQVPTVEAALAWLGGRA
ncbi:MAG: cobalt-precorrin-6A reductase [Rhodospirillales bacterium]|nr:MAG: cobalt-precorrin-6A reductase [Rhodospirillales bacterium]